MIALAENRSTFSDLHRDYLASSIEASVALPGRVLVLMSSPTLFLAQLTAARRSLAAQLGKLRAEVPILAEREEALGTLLASRLVALFLKLDGERA